MTLSVTTTKQEEVHRSECTANLLRPQPGLSIAPNKLLLFIAAGIALNALKVAGRSSILI
jgi:hypothetical protein